MGIKVQRVLDHAHSAMEPGRTILHVKTSPDHWTQVKGNFGVRLFPQQQSSIT